MRLVALAFTWMFVPLTWWGWMSSSGPERGVAFGWFTVALWGATTWSLWQAGVLRRIYGSSDLSARLAALVRETLAQVVPPVQVTQYPSCAICGLLVAPGINHANCVTLTGSRL